MDANRLEHDEDVTVVSNLECILRDNRRTFDAESVAGPVRNPPVAS